MKVEKILDMIKSRKINFEWTGSMGHMDCVEFTSNLFETKKFTMDIPKMGWENIEEYFAKRILEYVESGELKFKHHMICRKCGSANIKYFMELDFYIAPEDLLYLGKTKLRKKENEFWGVNDRKTNCVCVDCLHATESLEERLEKTKFENIKLLQSLNLGQEITALIYDSNGNDVDAPIEGAVKIIGRDFIILDNDEIIYADKIKEIKIK